MTRCYPTLAEERRQEAAERERQLLASHRTYEAIIEAWEARSREARQRFRMAQQRQRRKTALALAGFLLVGVLFLVARPWVFPAILLLTVFLLSGEQ
jgi:hypothetical protein